MSLIYFDHYCFPPFRRFPFLLLLFPFGAAPSEDVGLPALFGVDVREDRDFGHPV
jgi:hypothetical protein